MTLFLFLPHGPLKEGDLTVFDPDTPIYWCVTAVG